MTGCVENPKACFRTANLCCVQLWRNRGWGFKAQIMTPAGCCGRFVDIISLGNVLLDISDLFQIRGAGLELCLTGADSILYDLLLTPSIKTNHFTLSCQTGNFTFFHKYVKLFERNNKNSLRYTSWIESFISVKPLMVIKENNMVIWVDWWILSWEFPYRRHSKDISLIIQDMDLQLHPPDYLTFYNRK